MKIKRILMSCLVALSCVAASAQGQEPKTEYIFNPHWYLQVQPLGAQYTVGEVSFNKLVSYNEQLGVGYQINPVVGLRLSVNAWQSRAGYDNDGVVTKWKWKYVSPMVDVTANLSNLFCGYNPTRLFSLSAFVGLGANCAWSNGEAETAQTKLSEYNLRYLWKGGKTRLAGRAGLQADFRITDMVSVGAELQANTLNDHYNSKWGGNTDWYFNALVGVKVNLGKTYTKKVVTPPAPPAPKAEPKPAPKPEPKAAPAPAPKPEPKKEVREPLRRDIFFTISSTVIVEEEAAKIKEVADYLKKYPEAKVDITGHADRGTGNASINQRLSDKRATIVAEALMHDYNIAPSRITYVGKGDTVQPYAEQIKNRVSICIAQ